MLNKQVKTFVEKMLNEQVFESFTFVPALIVTDRFVLEMGPCGNG